MADELLQVLIEGYDPSKVEEDEVDKHWKEIYGAIQNQTILQAPVIGIETKLDKPCAVVSIGPIRGYIPLEFSGVENIRQLRRLSGQRVAFKVLNYDREENVFTASRKAALDQMAEITWKRLEEGQTILAVVRDVNPSRVRVDIGGIEVKIPIEEMAYGWIDDLTEMVKVGDHLKVKVVELDRDNKNVKVSAKAAQQNPWPECAKRYHEGAEYVGKVSGVREYGVFVNLEPGVDSLSRHLKFENVKKGDRVLVRILGVDIEKQQIRSRIIRVL